MNTEKKEFLNNVSCNGIICGGKTEGFCVLAKFLAHQANHGSRSEFGVNVWKKAVWEYLQERTKEALNGKDGCAYKEELIEALKIEPFYEEDIKLKP